MEAKRLVVYIVCILVFLQCRSNKKENVSDASSTMKSDSAQIDSANRTAFILLSPNEILNEILLEDATLKPGLVNPKSNAVKYIDAKHQALNLGVYITDFIYLNLNNNKTNALEYFKVIRDLAQRNNIYGCFDEATFDRIQENLANSDSLMSISQEMYYNMSYILENANRQNVYALISSGALIESLYLAVMSINTLTDFKGTAQRIFDQKQIFDENYSFISRYKYDKDVRSVIDQLDYLKKILEEPEVNTTKLTVTKDKNNHLVVKGGQDIVVNDTSFYKFKENVIKTRQEIIKF